VLFCLGFAGVIACCYVLIMMGTVLISLGSMATASAHPQDKGESVVFFKNLPMGSDTPLDTTLFDAIEGEPVSYEWFGPMPRVSGPTPDATIPEGTHALTLITFDGMQRSDPLTCYVRVEPAWTLRAHSRRHRVELELPRIPDARRLDIYRAPAVNPSAWKKIAQAGPDTRVYTDTPPAHTPHLYVVAGLSGGQWSFSRICAACPYGVLPRWNHAPVICSDPISMAQAGVPYTYDVLAVDVQEDTLSYFLDSPPEGMVIDEGTGLIQWMPRSAGDYEVTVRVRDKKGYAATQTFVVEVNDLVAPDKTPVASPGGPYTAEEGQEIVLDGSGSHDPDGAQISYEWDFGDGHHDTGVMPTHTYDREGTYRITLTVTDYSGGIAAAATTVVVQKSLAPAVSVQVNPPAVLPGEACSLVWKSERALSLMVDHGIGEVGPSGTLMIYPQSTTTITMTAQGRGGTTRATAVVLVHEPPVVDVDVVRTTLHSGETTAIMWASRNADSVCIDQGIGEVMPSGELFITPAESTLYTVTATGPGGTVSQSVAVDVLPCPLAHIRAGPDSLVPGEPALLEWDTSHAQVVTIDQGIGEVSPGGSIVVQPVATTTYTITATGPLGTATEAVTVAVHPRPSVTISAEPREAAQGRATLLSWSSEHAETASMDNGIGDVPVHGSREVSPDQTTTYVITVVGRGGAAMASVTVHIADQPEVVLTTPPDATVTALEPAAEPSPNPPAPDPGRPPP
jgi:PKD repeat protein